MMAAGVIPSLIFAGGCALAFAVLRLLPRWMQGFAAGGLLSLGGWLLIHGLWQMQGGAILAALMVAAIGWGLHAILTDIRRAEAAALSPSGQAPGGAHAPGEAGSATASDTRRDQAFPHVDATAGCAGRPRSFSGSTP